MWEKLPACSASPSRRDRRGTRFEPRPTISPDSEPSNERAGVEKSIYRPVGARIQWSVPFKHVVQLVSHAACLTHRM